MATFYGQVEGFSETLASRRGTDYIISSAQSYNGSVITRLNYAEDGRLMVKIYLDDDSSFYGNTAFYGTFDDLKECFEDWKQIEIVKKEDVE